MHRRETCAEKIARSAIKRFPSISTSETDVEQLVRFVLAKRNALERLQLQKIGDDARDYANTSYFLRRLSKKALVKIPHLKRSEIRQRLKKRAYPFLRLSQKTQAMLLHLPTSWIYGSANWLLSSR